MKKSEGQRRFLISFRNQLAAEAVAALCLNDSLDSHSFFPSFSLSLSFPSFCDVCLSLCVSFSCLLCCCDGSAFISIKCKSQARIFPIERRFRATDEVAVGQGTREGGGMGGGMLDRMLVLLPAPWRCTESWNVFHASLRFVFRHAKSSLCTTPFPLLLFLPLPCPLFYCS